jgi:hypothetical protein
MFKIEETKFVQLYDDAVFISCTVKDNETSLITDSKRIKHACINVFPGEYDFKGITETQSGKVAKLELHGENEIL